MIEKKSAGLILGALNLLTIGAPAMAANHVTTATSTDAKMEQINVASIQSIESTWLKVAAACKARGYNASPTPVDLKGQATHAQAIYADYQA